MKVLVRYHQCWADEFDVDGFRIMEADEWNALIAQFEEIPNWNFGSNEGFEGGETQLRHFDVVNISDAEAEILIKFFGEEYGIFPYLEDLLNEEDW
jgi:hypothetical protein